jgi:hypothetical protein
MSNNNSKKIKIITIVLLISFTASSVFPNEVYARNIFQKIGRALKKTVTFVVKLPDKTTRWMGPVLGPIAADVLTGNLSRSAKFGKIFFKAKKAHKIIQNIDEQKKLINDLKGAYKDEAQKLDVLSSQIRDARKQLAGKLTKGDIEFDDYMKQAVALEKLAQSYDKVANDFRHKADTIDEKTIVSLVTKNAANLLIGRVKDVVLFELKTQISKLIRDDVITRLLGKDIAHSDIIIDLLTEGEVNSFLSQTGGSIDEGEFKKLLREKIKQILKESKKDLQNNWKEKIQQVLEELSKQMQEEKGELKSISPENEKEKSNQKKIELDDFGCRPGYKWHQKMGKCIQSDCDSIEHAHYSYVLDCICGSSESIDENPEDPNKECGYSLQYESCPGCVYACVHFDEDCPLEGIGGY